MYWNFPQGPNKPNKLINNKLFASSWKPTSFCFKSTSERLQPFCICRCMVMNATWKYIKNEKWKWSHYWVTMNFYWILDLSQTKSCYLTEIQVGLKCSVTDQWKHCVWVFPSGMWVFRSVSALWDVLLHSTSSCCILSNASVLGKMCFCNRWICCAVSY